MFCSILVQYLNVLTVTCVLRVAIHRLGFFCVVIVVFVAFVVVQNLFVVN